MKGWLLEPVRRALEHGLSRLGVAGYSSRRDGSLYFSAQRPGPGWRRHGSSPRLVRDLRQGKIVELSVEQQRWFNPKLNQSRVDSAPDLLPGRRYTLLIGFVVLAGWILGAKGVHSHTPIFPALADRPSRRSMQRWLRTARAHAEELVQAVRAAWTEIGARQAGDEVGGGIPPPRVDPRPWRSPAQARQVEVGLSMVLGWAITLNVAGASLLAEARRRFPARPKNSA